TDRRARLASRIFRPRSARRAFRASPRKMDADRASPTLQTAAASDTNAARTAPPDDATCDTPSTVHAAPCTHHPAPRRLLSVHAERPQLVAVALLRPAERRVIPGADEHHAVRDDRAALD